ncbi:MAG: hypothetical protein IJK61_07525 [Bacteroidetes bacterium]|nr:hypothetical protein [Bacteroidota bacterium]
MREKDMKKQKLTSSVLKSIIQYLYQIVKQLYIQYITKNKSILSLYPIMSTLRTQLNWSQNKLLFKTEYKPTINNLIYEFVTIDELI